MPQESTIRTALLSDLEAITAIYNEAIRNTTATFDTDEKTVEQQRPWFAQHGPRHPILVAEYNEVVGWASLSPWSDRCAYSGTAEVSLYVHEAHRGAGIGKKLLAALVARGREAGLHTLLARIADGNEASIRLHKSLGFTLVGVMREVGFKFGRRLDVHLMQKMYCI